jgi:hypothetical protein
MSPSDNCPTTTSRHHEMPADELDLPLWGAEAIGRAANILTKDGKVDLRRTYYKLEEGHLPADKCGRDWVTTPRRLRKHFSGE